MNSICSAYHTPLAYTELIYRVSKIVEKTLIKVTIRWLLNILLGSEADGCCSDAASTESELFNFHLNIQLIGLGYGNTCT